MPRVAPRLALALALALAPLAAACHFDESGDPAPGRPDNRPPVAAPDVATTAEGVPVLIDVLANDADPDDDTLTLAWVRSGAHASAIVGGQIRVAPDPGFVGAIALEYGVSDGLDTTAGTVTVSVRPGVRPNQPPVAGVVVPPEIHEDSLATIELRGSDPDGDALTFAITTPPAHGALSGTPPILIYTPVSDYHGDDGFAFTVSDGAATSAPRPVALRVLSVDDPPVPEALSITLDEDTSRAVTLGVVDRDGNEEAFAYVVLPPSRGQLAGTPPDLIYTPDADVHGSDSFLYWLVDGLGVVTATAAVAIEIAPVDDPPAAQPGSITLREDATASVRLGGRDIDGDTVAYELRSAPAHGTLTGTPPDLVYRPDRDFAGDDSFTFVVTARGVASAPARVALQVEPVDDPARALPGAYAVVEDTAIDVVLGAVDIDSDLGQIEYRVTAMPTRGEVRGQSGRELIYHPYLDEHGTDQLTFEISDGTSTSSAVVTFVIAPVNDAPYTRDDVAIAAVDEPRLINVTRNDVDAEGDALRVIEVSAPGHGTASVTSDGDLRYAPSAGFAGDDTFTYTVVDAAGAAATATVRVGVGAFPRHVPLQLVGGVGTYTTDGAVGTPRLSRDGRLVAFLSSEQLVDDDQNELFDVYVYDRALDTLERITTAADGGEPDGHAYDPRISADGRYVVYSSAATNVVDGDTNGVSDVFVFEHASGLTRRVSVGDGGVEPNGDSFGVDIAADGTVVSFHSYADNLVAGDGNANSDVFVHDLAAGTTVRASVSASGGEANGESMNAVLSGNGQTVAFTSTATNLVEGDTNARRDVFVRDLAAGTTQRVSVSSSGAQSPDASYAPSISHDGRYVAFESYDGVLAFGCPGYCVYVRDRTARFTRLGSEESPRGAQISADGQYLLIWASMGYISIGRPGGERQRLGKSSVMPALSADNRYIAFESERRFGTPPWPRSYYNVWVLPNPM